MDRHEIVIEAFEDLKPALVTWLINTNYEGLGKQDAIEFSEHMDIAIKALKKQVPMKKYFDNVYTYSCPNCEEEMESDEQYCIHCGQHTWVE